MSKPTLTVCEDKLIEKGYVIKVQSDEDKRITHLHLTEKGKSFNNIHINSHKKFAEIVEGTLSHSETQQLNILLGKITNNL